MNVREKLHVLADAAKYDASCASSGAKRRGGGNGWGGMGNSDGTGICHSYTPDGRCVSLLKILLTNHCLYDCQYCINRISSDVPRARFTVDEVVRLTLGFYQRNYIEGLFLSSGIIQSIDYTMEQLVDVARQLRITHGFNGYIHLKTIPGASPALIAQAGRFADRLSANIELPTRADLTRLAPQKLPGDIAGSMGQVHHHIQDDRDKFQFDETTSLEKSIEVRHDAHNLPVMNPGERYAPAGQSTQMIVGATPTADGTILRTAAALYKTYGLKRVYFSAFSPIPTADSRLPAQQPPLVREHRLYQADWLMRYYGFSAGELTESDQASLPLDMDPKTAWALRNRGYFPVDLNQASRIRLLRIPGIGVRNVDRILSIRRHHKLVLQDLIRLRVALGRARPFIVVKDYHPNAQLLDHPALEDRLAGGRLGKSAQLNLFEATTSAVTGEV